MKQLPMRCRWTFLVLLVLLAACSQEAVAPTAPPPSDSAIAPTTLSGPIATLTAAPTPTQWVRRRVELPPTPEPTPVPIPTTPALVSPEGLYWPEVVWAEVLAPPTANDPLVAWYLTNDLVGVEGSYGIYPGRASLAERILTADVIARVNLVSKRTSVADRGGLWVALLEFRFRVHEYLKGSGPSEIGGLVYIEYPNGEADAREAATQIADAHDSRWDDREAIVFLWLDDIDAPDAPPFPRASDQYWLGNMALGPDGEAYTVSSRYRQAWLPEATRTTEQARRGASGASQPPAEKTFLLDAPSPIGAAGESAALSTVPTISLSNLKTRITTLEAEANAGGTPEYRRCVEHAYYRQRRQIHDVSQEGTPLEQDNATLSSSARAGTVLHTTYMATTSTDISPYYWYGGPDSDIVQPKALSPLTGHPTIIRVGHVTKRPLPAGSYSFFHNWANPVCPTRLAGADNHYRVDVTVSAPAGTLHEAFFDPVAIGNAVGADGTNGVLEPAAFTVDGTTTTISSLKWESGTATMVLSPSASLAGRAVDFIALDGSVTSTLAVDDATRSGGTLTWSAATQPWNAGDKLMLRIRPAAPAPAISISGLGASIEEGASDAFTVSASNLATANSYSIRVTTGDANVGFDAGCASRQQDAAVSSGSTSHDAAFTLHGCSAPGGTVTATLMQGAAAIATDTQQVTVTAAPTVQAAPAPTGLRVTGSTRTGVSVSWSAVQHAHRYKLERSPDGASGWSDVDDDISGTSRTVSGLSCGTTYHFRVSARGDGSTYSTEFGSPSTPSVSGATSACPAAEPAISISGLDASMEEGDSDAFTVSASNLASSTSYTIRVTTGGANVGFDAGCASRQQDATVSSGSTSHDASFTLHGCSAPGGTVTAALMQGATAVATATQQVTVTAPTDTETDSAVTRYDTNGDGVIDVHEYLAALRDYAAGKITWAEVLEVAEAYEKARG